MSLPEFIRPGAIVRLKGGMRARIYAIDGGGGFPIHGAIEMRDGWISSSWQEDMTWSNGEVDGLGWAIVGPDRPDYSALWPILPPWIRFLARDANGKLYAYSERPVLEDALALVFVATDDAQCLRIPDAHCPPPVGDWRDSLAERPTP